MGELSQRLEHAAIEKKTAYKVVLLLNGYIGARKAEDTESRQLSQ